MTAPGQYTTTYQRTFPEVAENFGVYAVTVDTAILTGVSHLWQVDIVEVSSGRPVAVFRGVLLVTRGLVDIGESP